MSIETLKSRMPDYAKDIKLNLGNIQTSTALSESQVWGSMLAAALASRHPDVTAAVLAEAERHVSPETIQAVKAASAVMAMNNVYYRSLHLIGDAEMMKMPARLRMNAMANPGVDKLDFEIYSTAVTAVNGCGMCLKAHVKEIKEKGASSEAVQDILRIAAVIHAAACVLDGETAMGEVRAAA